MELNRSILIVDDESDQARHYETLFARNGWRSKAVFGGSAALAELKDVEYGVVLLDMKMPEMDGFETLSAILEMRPDQCVVFFTGFGDVAAAVRALREGACSMVLKSGINFQVLLDSVEVELSRRTNELALRAERDAAIANAARLESTSALANGCAHSVKNRLVAISTRLTVAELATTLEKAKFAASEASAQLDKAFLVIKRLERICRLRELELKPVQLGNSLRQAIELVRETDNHARNVDIKLPGGVDEVFVMSEQDSLCDSLENLFENSVDAMFERGGMIEVDCVTTNGHADLTVFDSGPGFADEVLRTAHEPFRTTKRDRNLGYGLTFVKEVAECSGGVLEYGNRTDHRGAWVRLRLPLANR